MYRDSSKGDDMEMNPPAPSKKPEPAIVVLGRFQPLHRGHASLLRAAVEFRNNSHPDMILRIMLGSSNVEQSPENPWDWQEREEMVQSWLTNEGISNHEILAVPDIGDAQRWVEHASNWHGGAGIIATSNEDTAQLYSQAGWQVELIPLLDREDLQGWRVRETMKMVSTIGDEEAIRSILSESLEEVVVDWLLADSARIRRLAFLGPSVERVG